MAFAIVCEILLGPVYLAQVPPEKVLVLHTPTSLPYRVFQDFLDCLIGQALGELMGTGSIQVLREYDSKMLSAYCFGMCAAQIYGLGVDSA